MIKTSGLDFRSSLMASPPVIDTPRLRLRESGGGGDLRAAKGRVSMMSSVLTLAVVASAAKQSPATVMEQRAGWRFLRFAGIHASRTGHPTYVDNGKRVAHRVSPG